MLKFLDKNYFTVVLIILAFAAICHFGCILVSNYRMENAHWRSCVVIDVDHDEDGPFFVVAIEYEIKGITYTDAIRYYGTVEQFAAVSIGDPVYFDEEKQMVIPWMGDRIEQ